MPAVPQGRPQQSGGAYVDGSGQLWVYDFATGRYEAQQQAPARMGFGGMDWYANGGMDPALPPQPAAPAQPPRDDFAPPPMPAASNGGVDPSVMAELGAIEAQLAGPGFDGGQYAADSYGSSAPEAGGYSPPPMPTPGVAPPGVPTYPNGQAWGQTNYQSDTTGGTTGGGGGIARGPGGVAAGQGQAVGPDGQRANPGYASANGVMATPGMVDARRPESSVSPASGGGYSGGSSGGGGGGGGGFAGAMADKLKGGMLGGGSSYGYDEGPTKADYRQADRRYKQDQRALQAGWEQRAQFQSLLGNPQWAIPVAFPGLDAGSPGYQRRSQTPAGMLALIASGATGKDVFGEKPKKFQRTVADLYQDMESKSTALGYDDLMGNLFGAKKKSSLGHLFMEQEPGKVVTNKDDLYKKTKEGKWTWGAPEQQHDVLLGGLSAVYGRTLSPGVAASRMLTAQGLADQWASKSLGKKNPGSIQKWMGRKLGY